MKTLGFFVFCPKQQAPMPSAGFHSNPLLRRHRRLLVLGAGLLLAGTVNYYLFQPHIVLFQSIDHRLTVALPGNDPGARFLTGYCADLLWCSALMLVTVVMTERIHLHFTHRLLILTLPFATEFAQSAGIINGVFDWLDIVIYGMVELVAFMLFPVLLSRRYEK